MKILIIEDERKLSQNIVTYLSSDNYICEQAYNFNDAIEKIALYSYDCILLDLNLPDGDGLKILEDIKQREITSGIIIISARGSLDDKITGLKTGADDYLAKPLSGDMADMFDNHNFIYAHIKNLKSKLGAAGFSNRKQ
jgi:DNA-binding response OmpR family regulator